MLRFTDGVTIDVWGPMRMHRLHDGLYVVGGGVCIPVDDAVEAKAIIEMMQTKSKPAP